MSRLSSPTDVRVNRRYYVNVDSATVRNTRLSYRSLGLLVYLLDQTEGWQVRSDQLSKGEGREGRGAVRTALRELAVEGHYRLERRRLRNGKCVMGTALSVYPVPQWVEDHKIFSTQKDPAVPVVEQPDGTFLVEYPDGTLGSDGFEPDPRDQEEPPTDPEPEPEEEPAAEEEPSAAPPKKPARARRPRRTPEEKAATDAEKTAAADRKAVLDEKATAGAQWWWGTAAKKDQPAKKGRADELADTGVIPRYVGDKSRAYHGVRRLIRNALAAGYDRGTVAQALENTKRPFPSQQQFEDACAAAAGVHIDRPRFGSSRAAAYSDTANWGDQNSGTPTTSTPTAPDDVTFGVIKRP